MSKVRFVPTINGIVRARESLKSDQITGYIIKGMWYFDKRRGELDYRLLGLKPIGLDIKSLKTNLLKQLKTLSFSGFGIQVSEKYYTQH